MNGNSPRITVVTIVYNLINANRREDFLRCVESVRNQTYKNIEHIIIDGASTDGTRELIQSTGLKYYSEPDNGIYDAMNKGIAKATGKYITFLNSDDHYYNTAGLQVAIALLEKTNLDYCYSDARITKNNEKISTFLGTEKYFIYGRFYCHQTQIVKLEVIKELSGFRQELIGADNDFMLRLVAHNKKGMFVPTGYVSFDNSGFSTSIDPIKAQKEHIRVFHELFGEKFNLSFPDCENMVKHLHYHDKNFKDYLLKNITHPLWNEAVQQDSERYASVQREDISIPRGYKKKYFILGIPVLRISRENNIKRVNIFGIPFLRTTKNETTKRVRLFGLPLLKTQRSEKYKRYFLFGFLRIYKKKINREHKAPNRFKAQFYRVMSHLSLGNAKRKYRNKYNDYKNAKVLAFNNQIRSIFEPYMVELNQNLTRLGQDVGALGHDVGTLGQDVGALGQDVGALGQDVGALGQDVGALGQDVDVLKQDVGALGQDVGALGQDVGALGQDVGALKQDVGTLRQDVGALRQDVGAFRQDVGAFRQDVGALGGGVELIQQKESTIQRTISSLGQTNIAILDSIFNLKMQSGLINKENRCFESNVFEKQNLKKVIFTICSNNYLAQAKSLGDSVLKFCPGYMFVIVLCDKKNPNVDYTQFANFDVIEVEELGFKEFNDMCNRYSIIELNTSVKPFSFEYFYNTYQADIVMYFDPDTYLFSDLSYIEDKLQTSDIVLTPHIVHPLEFDGFQPTENSFTQYGTYNLGFLGTRKSQTTDNLLAWWKDRLEINCYSRAHEGVFVDQLPMNFAPLFFDKVYISKNLGLNMAPWNLHERLLSKIDGKWVVNQKDNLIFYHFSNSNPKTPEILSTNYTRYTFEDSPNLKELYETYRNTVLSNGYETLHKIPYAYEHVEPCSLKTEINPATSIYDERCSTNLIVPNVKPHIFYWDTVWEDYLRDKDRIKLATALSVGLDQISQDYIEKFLQLLALVPYKNDILIEDDFAWTQKDIEVRNKLLNYVNTGNYSQAEAFIHATNYGLDDVIDEIRKKVYGKAVIDGGAYTGDTVVLFNKNFPQSHIYAFEPQKNNFEGIEKRLEQLELKNIVTVYNQGLSDTCGELTFYFNNDIDAGATFQTNEDYPREYAESIETTTIDSLAQEIQSEIGLIKLDIEGHEKVALQGAIKTIKRDKPVIIAALYHNPVDFFEIKPFLHELNPDYKFMIRRSEMVIPMGDIILIAY